MVKEHSPRRPEDWDDLFTKSIEHESDRAVVILSATFLDSALELLLKAFLVPCASSQDPLFDGVKAPLGEFSGRIEGAYRMGLIEPSFARALHLVRRIRNDFAHNISGCTFSDSIVMSRMAELEKCMNTNDAEADTRSCFVEGPRGTFEMAVSYLMWMLHCATEDLSPLSSNGAANCSFKVEPGA